MTISTQTWYNGIADALSSQEAMLTTLESQIASGVTVQHVSDGPSVADSVFSIDSTLSRLGAYSASNSDAQNWMNESMTNLQLFSNAYQQMVQIGLQAENGTSSTTPLALQAANLVESLLSAANSQMNGLSLFAGSQTKSQAFTISGSSVIYNGDGYVRQSALADGVTIATGTPGTALQAALQAAVQLSSDLSSGTSSAYQSDLAALQAAQPQINDAITQVGANLQTAQTFAQQQQSLSTELSAQKSGAEDANIAAVSAQYAALMNEYQATVAAEGDLFKLPSLAQYIS